INKYLKCPGYFIRILLELHVDVLTANFAYATYIRLCVRLSPSSPLPSLSLPCYLLLLSLPPSLSLFLSLSLSLFLSLSVSVSYSLPRPPHLFSLFSFYCFCLFAFLCVRESLCEGEAETHTEI